ncbi:MAG: Uncharacterised protein [Opitutia bacterium UBA7350]|nr:MAG: Uncharacterised protein [Opitutae bacterium UBA7350]
MKIQAITVALLTTLVCIAANGNPVAERPILVDTVAPQARDATVGTVVTALLRVSEQGGIEDVKIGYNNTPRFAEAVAEVVKQWRFTPAIRDGQAVRSLVLVPFKVIPADTELSMR